VGKRVCSEPLSGEKDWHDQTAPLGQQTHSGLFPEWVINGL